MSHVCNAERCDLCSEPFVEGDLVYDARIRTGQWSTICRICFMNHGVGLGTGKGQEYAYGNPNKLRG